MSFYRLRFSLGWGPLQLIGRIFQRWNEIFRINHTHLDIYGLSFRRSPFRKSRNRQVQCRCRLSELGLACKGQVTQFKILITQPRGDSGPSQVRSSCLSFLMNVQRITFQMKLEQQIYTKNQRIQENKDQDTYNYYKMRRDHQNNNIA